MRVAPLLTGPVIASRGLRAAVSRERSGGGRKPHSIMVSVHIQGAGAGAAVTPDPFVTEHMRADRGRRHAWAPRHTEQ